LREETQGSIFDFYPESRPHLTVAPKPSVGRPNWTRIIEKCLEKGSGPAFTSTLRKFGADSRAAEAGHGVRAGLITGCGGTEPEREFRSAGGPLYSPLRRVAGIRWQAVYFYSRRRAPKLTDKDTIVSRQIFNNKTGDADFDETLRQGAGRGAWSVALPEPRPGISASGETPGV